MGLDPASTAIGGPRVSNDRTATVETRPIATRSAGNERPGRIRTGEHVVVVGVTVLILLTLSTLVREVIDDIGGRDRSSLDQVIDVGRDRASESVVPRSVSHAFHGVL